MTHGDDIQPRYTARRMKHEKDASYRQGYLRAYETMMDLYEHGLSYREALKMLLRDAPE